MMCDGSELTHGSQMIGEWEQYSDRAGSIMESGSCESQLPKNSLNLYATASEGEGCAETHFWMCSIRGDAKESTLLWGLKLAYWVCDQAFEGLWAQREGLERQGEETVQECALSLQGGLKTLWKKTTKMIQQGAEQFWQQRQLCAANYSNQRREQYKLYCPPEAAVILHISDCPR